MEQIKDELRQVARHSCVLLDSGGVVFVGDEPIAGSIEGIERLRSAGIPLRFLTNATRRSLRKLIVDLGKLGLAVSEEEVFTPAQAARVFSKRMTFHPSW